MTRVGLGVLIAITLGAATFVAQGQQPPTGFPLAAPAGQNSNAKTTEFIATVCERELRE